MPALSSVHQVEKNVMIVATRKADQRARVVLPDDFANETIVIERIGTNELRLRKKKTLAQLVAGITTTGFLLADHIKSLDWRVRKARFRERIPGHLVQEVIDTTVTLLEPENTDNG